MLPEVGSRKCVSRLKQVVLPAPFGPIRAWMVPRRTLRATPLTATKPLNSLVSPLVSRIMSSAIHRSVLRWRALLDEGVHPGAAFLVREARRDYARSELVGLVQAEVHLLVERTLARRDGSRRFRSDLPCQFFRFKIKLIGGNHPVDQAPLERLASIDRLAGDQHLHRVLAREVAADSDPGRRAEESPGYAPGDEPGRLGGDRKVALGDELAAGRGRSALDARDHGLGQRGNGLHHAAALAEQGLDLRLFPERADLPEIMAGAKAFAGCRQDDNTGPFIIH